MALTFKFLLSNEILLLLVPLAFFLLVAIVRAVTGKELPMSKVRATIKAALFGIFLASVVGPFKVPVESTPYILEIHGLIMLLCWANLVAYLLVDAYLHHRMKRNVPSFLRDILQLGVYLFFSGTALRVIFDINMASILTTTTVLTAALAFAMQTSLANIISGFQIQADEAFGPRNPELLQRVARSLVDRFGAADAAYEVGDVVQFPRPDGAPGYAGTVREVGDDWLLFDFNHPLAGQSVTLEVQVIEVL